MMNDCRHLDSCRIRFMPLLVSDDSFICVLKNEVFLQLAASKGVEFEREILEAECSFISDKIGQLQDKVSIASSFIIYLIFQITTTNCLLQLTKKNWKLSGCHHNIFLM